MLALINYMKPTNSGLILHCKNACVVFTLTHCDTHKNTHSHMRVIYCFVMVTHCLRVTLHLPKWLKSCKRF